MMPGEASPTGALHPDALVDCGNALALFLDGAVGASFIHDLVWLIAQATPAQRAQLRMGFPDEVLAWELWSAMDDHPTARELVTVIAMAAE